MATRDSTLCCSLIRSALPRVISEFEAKDQNVRLFIVSTLRTQKEQQEAYAKGRTLEPIGEKYIVTKLDGVTTKSRHQAQDRHGEIACHAIDFGVEVRGHYERNDTKLYEPLMLIAEAHGLRSGQDWDCDGNLDTGWKDFPHVECRGEHAAPQSSEPALEKGNP